MCDIARGQFIRFPETVRTSCVMFDVPDEVRNNVIADGNTAWLDELPSVVASLSRDWSLTIGGTLRGGHAALVVEATLADGTEAVLKVGVPKFRRDLTFEATVLRLADGDGCASLLRDDLDRDALSSDSGLRPTAATSGSSRSVTCCSRRQTD
jgi:hypothetical protein